MSLAAVARHLAFNNSYCRTWRISIIDPPRKYIHWGQLLVLLHSLSPTAKYPSDPSFSLLVSISVPSVHTFNRSIASPNLGLSPYADVISKYHDYDLKERHVKTT